MICVNYVEGEVLDGQRKEILEYLLWSLKVSRCWLRYVSLLVAFQDSSSEGTVRELSFESLNDVSKYSNFPSISKY